MIINDGGDKTTGEDGEIIATGNNAVQTADITNLTHDSYFTFARNFLSGAITLTKLEEAMRLGRLGTQFVLKSRKAFLRMEFKEATVARASDWFAIKKGRDDEARRTYRDMRAVRERNGLYITRIMDEEMTADDLRV